MKQSGCRINGRNWDVVEERWEAGSVAQAVLRINKDAHPGNFVPGNFVRFKGCDAIVTSVVVSNRVDGPWTVIKLSYFPQRQVATDAVEILVI